MRPHLVWTILTLGLAAALTSTWHDRSTLTTALIKTRQQVALPMEGTVLPELRLVTPSGDSVVVARSADSSTREMLVASRAGCPACQSSVGAWRTLLPSAAARGARVWFLSIDGPDTTAAFVARHHLDVPAALLRERDIELLRLRFTPLILVVDGRGVVRYHRFGALETAQSADSVLRALSPTSAAPRAVGSYDRRDSLSRGGVL